MFARMHLFRSFRAAFGHGRNFRSNTDSLDTLRPRPANHGMGMGARRPVVSAAAAGAGNLVQLLTKTAWGARLCFGMLTGTAAGAAAWHWKEDNEEAGPFETAEIAWVQQLAEQPGMKEMLVPGQMLRKHPVGQLISTDDHLSVATSSIDAEGTTSRRVRAPDSTDAVASFLSRRFGLAGGLAWLGVLAIGTLGEQVKTRMEVAAEKAGTQDVGDRQEVVLPSGVNYVEERIGGGQAPIKGYLVVVDY
eukprot:gene14184-14328_t